MLRASDVRLAAVNPNCYCSYQTFVTVAGPIGVSLNSDLLSE